MTTKIVETRKRNPRKIKDVIKTIKGNTSNTTLLKKGTIIYNSDSGDEWLLLEDVKDDFTARCICTYVPAMTKYEVGMKEEFRIYYQNGTLAFHWKVGRNKNH